MQILYFRVIFFLAGIFSATFVQAQITLKGIVIDYETNEPMIGAGVFVVGTQQGAASDDDGNFTIQYQGKLPVTLQVVYIGYDTLNKVVETADKPIRLSLREKASAINVVEIVDYRITQKEKESPLTVEKLDLIAIKETPATNFYDGLGNLKGVDVTAAALGFKVINTRGFNSTQPVRSLQLIDGIDNQAPGLNFAIGNLVGSSELDVHGVDIIVGASAAQFGPGAFNGVINMTTKSPFIHKGLNVQLKMGERSLFDGAIRVANVFTNKNKREVFAFKINAAYMRAYDWEATNTEPTEQSTIQEPKGVNNPGGYDAINRYGDENRDERQNNFSSNFSRRLYPGLGVIYRTGYNEKDIADYNTSSRKISGSLHYKPNEKTEIIYGYRYGAGTTVFQGINRISLKNLVFQQHSAEIKGENYFVRAYTTLEDAGNSYDIVRTAALMQRQSKDDVSWTQDYFLHWNSSVLPKLKNLEQYKELPRFGSVPSEEYYSKLDNFLASIGDSLQVWHQQTRAFADSKTDKGQAFVKPGTQEFKDRFNKITSNPASGSDGTKFQDFSKLYHLQGEYRFKFKFAECKLGGNYRIFAPLSNGTIFVDTLNTSTGLYNKITTHEAGAYLVAEKRFIIKNNPIKLTFSGRGDLHQNYIKKPIFSPSLSAVYTVNKQHHIRASFNYGFRFPTLQDQYLNYNVDGIILRGNLEGVNNVITIQSLYDFFATSDTVFLKPINVSGVKPERVRTFEIGYKSMLFKRLFVDASYYYSWYSDFIGYQFVSSSPFVDGIPKPFQILRLSTNAPGAINTQGFAIGLNLYLGKYYSVNGNYSWNQLQGDLPARKARDPYAPFLPAFNTPAHKFNIGFGGTNIIIRKGDKNYGSFGFNTNFKWVDGFYFEGSPQYTGFINSYGVLDAQINYTYPKAKTTIKIGATNILNQQYIQVYGGPYIGRLAYISLNFDWVNWDKF